jgi:hypothetical protein
VVVTVAASQFNLQSALLLPSKVTLLGASVVVEVVKLLRSGEAEVQNQREGSIVSVVREQKFTRMC